MLIPMQTAVQRLGVSLTVLKFLAAVGTVSTVDARSADGKKVTLVIEKREVCR